MESRIARLRQHARVDFDENRAGKNRRCVPRSQKLLKAAILCSKKASWKELISPVDNDSFVKPFKLELRKLRDPAATTTMEWQTLYGNQCSVSLRH